MRKQFYYLRQRFSKYSQHKTERNFIFLLSHPYCGHAVLFTLGGPIFESHSVDKCCHTYIRIISHWRKEIKQ